MKIFINKKGIIILMTSFLSMSFYSGQTIPVIKSPQTYSIEKFGNIPVSMNTGSVSYNVDLYNYGDIYNGNGYDISLNYYGTGFVPAKKSNYTGLDWSLNIGGTISRQVRGIADDFYPENATATNVLYGYLEGMRTCNKTNNDIYNGSYSALPKGNGGIGIKCGTNSYEVEPDKFSFNFMGYNGYFFIGNDGLPIIVSDDKNLKIDVSGLSSRQPLLGLGNTGVRCQTKQTTIVITDGKGIKYSFGGNYENLDISYSLQGGISIGNSTFTISAWNLYKIEYPNSRTIEIKYRTDAVDSTQRNFCVNNADVVTMKEPFVLMMDHNTLYKQEYSYTNLNYALGNILFDGTIYWGNINTVTSGPVDDRVGIKKSFPSSILLDGKTIVTFDFQRYDKYWPTDAIATQKLSNIVFYDITGNKVVKDVNMSYYRNKDYFFLDKLKMQKKTPSSSDYFQEYSFDYYRKDDLPYENDGKLDIWGYYNEKPMNKMIPNYSLNRITGDYAITDNTRDPNPAVCSVSLLKTITYPTKGRSEFIYEPHQYSKKIDRNSASQFKNVLIQASGSVGGGRLSKINNYSNDGSLIGTKEYKYINNYTLGGSNALSSGILTSYFRNIDYSNEVVHNGSGTINTETLHVYSDNILESAMNSFPVQYSEVTEIDNNKGYTKYYFTDYIMYPDSSDFKEVYNNTTNNANSDISNIPANMNNINLPYRSNDYKRGKLYKQEIYDQNFTKLKTSTTDFIDVSEIIPINFATYLANRPLSNYFFKLYGGSFSPNKTVVDEIFNNNLISSQTEYSYQSGNGLNLSSVKNTDTDGTIRQTSYLYAHEKGNQKLINANVIDTPLETATIKTVNGVTYTISKSETRYDNPTNLYPSSVLSYDVLNVASTDVVYDLYDDKGNLLQYTTKDGLPVTIIWGYSQTQPIAKIEGITYADLATKLGFANTNTGYKTLQIVTSSDLDTSDNYETQTFIPLLNSFRTNTLLKDYQISTYTYDLQKGVTSITPPSGIREAYIYDTANRLMEIRENDRTGNLLKEFKYNFKN